MLVQQTGAKLLASYDGSLARGFVENLIAMLRQELADDVWAWYRAHENDELVSLKVLGIVPVTVRVRHARKLFVTIAGPEPAL